MKADLVEAYNIKRGNGVPSLMVTHDVAPLVSETRLILSRVLMHGAPTANGFNGANRPRIHHIPLDIFTVECVAYGFLELMRKLGGPPLALERGNKGEPDEWAQLVIKDLHRPPHLRLLQPAARQGGAALLGQRAPHGQPCALG